MTFPCIASCCLCRLNSFHSASTRCLDVSTVLSMRDETMMIQCTQPFSCNYEYARKSTKKKTKWMEKHFCYNKMTNKRAFLLFLHSFCEFSILFSFKSWLFFCYFSCTKAPRSSALEVAAIAWEWELSTEEFYELLE